MFIVGFDLGKRKSQLCVENSDGAVLAELRIDTKPEALVAAVSAYPKARVIIEASTSAEWVARVLEEAGCDVVVADPRFSLMYAQSNKKVKNDRRDARALADALRLGAFRRAHRRTTEARQLHAELLVRERLVKIRTQLINLVRAMCEREGVIVPACRGEEFAAVMEDVVVVEWLGAAILPAVTQIESLTQQLAQCDKAFVKRAKEHPVARNLQTVRGVGPLTSLAFVAVIDDPTRFQTARQVTAYLGLVPGENNSGDSKRPPGAITKTGDPMLRHYLVEAAYSMTNKLAPVSPLKSWSEKLLSTSRGASKKRVSKKRAAVAVARRLARILWAMWRDDKPFDASRTAPLQPQRKEAA